MSAIRRVMAQFVPGLGSGLPRTKAARKLSELKKDPAVRLRAARAAGAARLAAVGSEGMRAMAMLAVAARRAKHSAADRSRFASAGARALNDLTPPKVKAAWCRRGAERANAVMSAWEKSEYGRMGAAVIHGRRGRPPRVQP